MTTIDLPLVQDCSVSECSYNNNGCAAGAVTIGYGRTCSTLCRCLFVAVLSVRAPLWVPARRRIAPSTPILSAPLLRFAWDRPARTA